MNLLNRMKDFEGQYVFLRWATGAEYGKVILVGDDFIEFNIMFFFKFNFTLSTTSFGLNGFVI